jgi:hypothetical protein
MATQAKEMRTRGASLNPPSEFGQSGFENKLSNDRRGHMACLCVYFPHLSCCICAVCLSACIPVSLVPSCRNRNGSQCSVRDLCRTDLCKNPGKSASLSVPFNRYSTLEQDHRVYRVQAFFPVIRIGSPPHLQVSVAPPLDPGGDTLACRRGVGGTNSDKGMDTLVL